VARAKRHLHLTDEEQEASLREILSQRLLFENGSIAAGRDALWARLVGQELSRA